MIDNFRKEVEQKLDIDEIIKEDFIASNYESLQDSTTLTALSFYTVISTAGYSFKHHFIVTNKRVFIGNTNPNLQVIEYHVYNLEEIADIKIDEVEYKSDNRSVMKLIYIAGMGMALGCLYKMLDIAITKFELVDSPLASIMICLAIPSVIVYFAYKSISKIKPKLVATIKFKDKKEVNIMLKKRDQVNCLKAI